jgi:hypothetical protein
LSSSGPVAQTERNFLDRIPHPISCLISIALVRNSLKVVKDHQTSNPSVSHRKMDLCKKERRFSVYESCGVGRSGFSHQGGHRMLQRQEAREGRTPRRRRRGEAGGGDDKQRACNPQCTATGVIILGGGANLEIPFSQRRDSTKWPL